MFPLHCHLTCTTPVVPGCWVRHKDFHGLMGEVVDVYKEVSRIRDPRSDCEFWLFTSTLEIIA